METEGERSSEVPVTPCVPQDSVLGSLLFLLYFNVLPQNIRSQLRLFDNDTAVFLTVTASVDANTLQANLDNLREWERTWNIKFNPGKCKVPYITRCKQPLQSRYTLHCQILESTNSAKYLSVSISKDLNWNNHINEITSKGNRTLGFVALWQRKKQKRVHQRISVLSHGKTTG